MSNSVRRQVLDNVKTTIAAIAAGSFNLTCGECKRGYKHFNAIPESSISSSKFAACIPGADEKRVNSAQRTFTSDLLVSIAIYVKAGSGAQADLEALEQKLDDAIEDVTKALLSDVTRGGIAVTTEIQEIDTDKGAFQPYAAAEIVVRVQYRASATQP